MKTLNVIGSITIILFLLTTALTGCTRKVDNVASVTLKFPGSTNNLITQIESSSIQSKVSILSSTDWNTSLNPSDTAIFNGTALDNINCYAIFVEGPEPDMNKNSCRNESTGAGATTITNEFRFGRHLMFIPKSANAINFEVPSGLDRKIYIVGLVANTSAGTTSPCVNLPAGVEPDFTNLSNPYLIAESEKLNLLPGDRQVDITANFNAATKILNKCDIHTGGGDSDDGNADQPVTSTLFGDGRDGDLVITNSNSNTGESYDTINGSGSITSTGTPTNPIVDLSNKIFSRSEKLNSVATISSTEMRLTLANIISANDFEIGDEIMWHVDASDGAGCGAGLNPGSWGGAHVTGTDYLAKTITIDKPIGQTDATLNNGLIVAPNSGNIFCRIQILRVPNFNKITITANTTIDSTLLTMNSSQQRGGIIAFRAKEIEIQESATLTINASEKGFAGGTSTFSGQGVHGDNPSSIGGGGGGGSAPSAGGGGGGGHTGIGGNGGNLPNSGGTGVPGSHDSILNNHGKFFFGGGGGGTPTSNIGGNGGGAIILHVGKITGPGILTIQSNGTNTISTPGDNGAGGGAGGTVHLTTQFIQNPSNITLKANGGFGGNGTPDGPAPDTNGGGGGGSGLVEVAYCDEITTPTINAINTNNLSGTGGSFSGMGAIGGSGTSTSPNIHPKSGDICAPLDIQ